MLVAVADDEQVGHRVTGELAGERVEDVGAVTHRRGLGRALRLGDQAGDAGLGVEQLCGVGGTVGRRVDLVERRREELHVDVLLDRDDLDGAGDTVDRGVEGALERRRLEQPRALGPRDADRLAGQSLGLQGERHRRALLEHRAGVGQLLRPATARSWRPPCPSSHPSTLPGPASRRVRRRRGSGWRAQGHRIRRDPGDRPGRAHPRGGTAPHGRDGTGPRLAAPRRAELHLGSAPVRGRRSSTVVGSAARASPMLATIDQPSASPGQRAPTGRTAVVAQAERRRDRSTWSGPARGRALRSPASRPRSRIRVAGCHGRRPSGRRPAAGRCRGPEVAPAVYGRHASRSGRPRPRSSVVGTTPTRAKVTITPPTPDQSAPDASSRTSGLAVLRSGWCL